MIEHAKANNFSVPIGRDCKRPSSVRLNLCRWNFHADCMVGHRLLDAIHGVQLGYYGIFKTSALITVNVGWDAIHIELFFH